ncbi:ABC transporter ATP-binding protein [Desulfopila aestuarii]|uniref:ABC-2 type transport system ATP-binding protein n=1 Tax=Desulfopila aestuarii DSM 18488 TaxID=1121416 RepID=A0A1M7Y4M8_9BACT|nr:ABC transporter ATP-binding protein [Desulfopila aestuarii]SHO47277.1 ABC-2 type transport system ATP-binding protein [Desulfopila aestuarii DSM 18488]
MTAINDHMLELRDLTKSFGTFHAVDGVSLTLGKGEIYGFLGPNGAGKTTTIKMMAGLLLPTSGEMLIGGFNMVKEPIRCKAITGYIPDRPFLYEKLTGDEYLRFISSLYPGDGAWPLPEAADDYLELFDLTEWRHHLIEGYSHGMRQKLIMTSVLMLDQPLIIVDEPMVGLDPKSARIVKELFKKKAEEGTSIFLSTHSMEIAEELCDRIAILVNGKIRATGTVEELRALAKAGSGHLEDIFLELTGAFELQEVIKALRTGPRGVVTGNKQPGGPA